VGATSAVGTATLHNNSSSTLTFTTAFAISGDFSFDPNSGSCGSSVAAGGSCTITLLFKPTATGTRTGAVTVSDNATGSPQTLKLTGTGVSSGGGSGAVATFSPTSLTFASTTVGSTSAAQTAKLSNTGSASLTITGWSWAGTNVGDFAATSNCLSSLAASASCTTSVTFKPTASGTRTATLSVTDNAGGSPQSLSLTGAGVSSGGGSGGANYYVSTTGGDSNSGSSSSPWATIAHASSVVGAGATVHVLPGTYSGNFTTNASGTSNARIIYVSDTPWGAKIASSSWDGTNNQNIWDNEGNYVTIQGFDISGKATTALGNGGSFTVLKGNHIHNVVPQTCNSNGGAAIDDSSYTGQGNYVIGNVINDVGNLAGGCSYYHGIYVQGTGSYIWNNIVYHIGANGIQLWGQPSSDSISGNTVFNNGGDGLIIGSDLITATNIMVTDNIFMNNGIHGVEETGSTGANQYIDNLVTGNTGTAFQLQTGTQSGTVTANPLFVNYQADPVLVVPINGGLYWKLQSTSPAIKAGTSQGAPTYDFDGVARPQGSSWDIGAYEFQ
jgi:hypothetical protein